MQFVAIASPSPTFLLIESSSKPAVLPPVSQCALRACPIRIRLHSTDMQIPQWHRHRVQSLLHNADRESRLCSFIPCTANKSSSGQPIKCSVMFINRAPLAWCSESHEYRKNSRSRSRTNGKWYHASCCLCRLRRNHG